MYVRKILSGCSKNDGLEKVMVQERRPVRFLRVYLAPLPASDERWWFTPQVWMIPWRRKWEPTPVFLPHGQRSLAGYSPWSCKESDTTEAVQHPACTKYNPKLQYPKENSKYFMYRKDTHQLCWNDQRFLLQSKCPFRSFFSATGNRG